MFKLIITVKKKTEISINEFIRHYEGHHAPMLCRILPPIQEYRRNYIVLNDRLTQTDETELDFHVFTELLFASRENAERFMAAFFSQENYALISNDEANFVAPNGVKAYIVEVYESTAGKKIA